MAAARAVPAGIPDAETARPKGGDRRDGPRGWARTGRDEHGGTNHPVVTGTSHALSAGNGPAAVPPGPSPAVGAYPRARSPLGAAAPRARRTATDAGGRPSERTHRAAGRAVNAPCSSRSNMTSIPLSPRFKDRTLDCLTPPASQPAPTDVGLSGEIVVGCASFSAGPSAGRRSSPNGRS